MEIFSVLSGENLPSFLPSFFFLSFCLHLPPFFPLFLFDEIQCGLLDQPSREKVGNGIDDFSDFRLAISIYPHPRVPRLKKTLVKLWKQCLEECLEAAALRNFILFMAVVSGSPEVPGDVCLQLGCKSQRLTRHSKRYWITE